MIQNARNIKLALKFLVKQLSVKLQTEMNNKIKIFKIKNYFFNKSSIFFKNKQSFLL